MFEGQKVFLDLRDYLFLEKLELDIHRLGGTVEKFLSRETTCVISNRENVIREKDPGLRECTPSPRSGDTHQTVLVPLDSNADKISNCAMSRGQKLLMRSNSFKSNTKLSGITCDPVQFARTWNIPIISINSAIRAVKSGGTQLTPSVDGKCSGKAVKLQVRRLLGSFLKIEDIDAEHRPFFIELPSFPSIKSCPEIGVSIFDTVSKVSKQNLRCENLTESLNTKKVCETPIAPKDSGYCECCDTYYKNLKKHLHGHTHRKFANSRVNFASLDSLITELSAVNLTTKLLTVSDANYSVCDHRAIVESKIVADGNLEYNSTSIPLLTETAAVVKDEPMVIVLPTEVAVEGKKNAEAMPSDVLETIHNYSRMKLFTNGHEENLLISKGKLLSCPSKTESNVEPPENVDAHTSPVEQVCEKSTDQVHAHFTALTNVECMVHNNALESLSRAVDAVHSAEVVQNSFKNEICFEIEVNSLRYDGHYQSENSALLSSDRVENILALLSSENSQCDANDPPELSVPLLVTGGSSTIGESNCSVTTQLTSHFGVSDVCSTLAEDMSVSDKADPHSPPENKNVDNWNTVLLRDYTDLTLNGQAHVQTVGSFSDVKEQNCVQLENAVPFCNAVTNHDEKRFSRIGTGGCVIESRMESSVMQVSPSDNTIILTLPVPQTISGNPLEVDIAADSNVMEVCPTNHSWIISQSVPVNKCEVHIFPNYSAENLSFSDISSVIDEGYEAVIDDGMSECNQRRLLSVKESVVQESVPEGKYEIERFAEQKAVLSVASVDSAVVVVTDDLCDDDLVVSRNIPLNESIVNNSVDVVLTSTDEMLFADKVHNDETRTAPADLALFCSSSPFVVRDIVGAANTRIAKQVEEAMNLVTNTGYCNSPKFNLANIELEYALFSEKATISNVNEVAVVAATEAEISECVPVLPVSLHEDDVPEVQLVKMMDICSMSDMLDLLPDSLCIPSHSSDTTSEKLSLIEQCGEIILHEGGDEAADSRVPYSCDFKQVDFSINGTRDELSASDNQMKTKSAVVDDLLESECTGAECIGAFEVDFKTISEQRTLSTPAMIGTPNLDYMPMEQDAFTFQLLPEMVDLVPALDERELRNPATYDQKSPMMNDFLLASAATTFITNNNFRKNRSKWDTKVRGSQSAENQSCNTLNDTTDVIRELEILEMLAARLVTESASSGLVSDTGHCINRTLHDDLLLMADHSKSLNQNIYASEDYSQPVLNSIDFSSEFPNSSVFEEDLSTFLDDCNSLSEFTPNSIYHLHNLVESQPTTCSVIDTDELNQSNIGRSYQEKDIPIANLSSYNISAVNADVTDSASGNNLNIVFGTDCENRSTKVSPLVKACHSHPKHFGPRNHKLSSPPITSVAHKRSAMSDGFDRGTDNCRSALTNVFTSRAKQSRSSRVLQEEGDVDVDVVTVTSPPRSFNTCESKDSFQTDLHLLSIPLSRVPRNGFHSGVGASQPNFGIWQVISFGDLRIRLQRVADNSLAHAGIT